MARQLSGDAAGGLRAAGRTCAQNRLLNLCAMPAALHLLVTGPAGMTLPAASHPHPPNKIAAGAGRGPAGLAPPGRGGRARAAGAGGAGPAARRVGVPAQLPLWYAGGQISAREALVECSTCLACSCDPAVAAILPVHPPPLPRTHPQVTRCARHWAASCPRASV